MKKIVFAGMLLFGLLILLAGAEAEMRPKRVLLLRDFDANYRWPTLLSDRILDYYREEPEARAPIVTSVSLGGRNKESGEQFRFLVLDDLKKKRYDLVICLTQSAADLLYRYREELPEELDIVLGDCSDLQTIRRFGNATGVLRRYNLEANIQFGLKLFPETERILVAVSGDDETGRLVEETRRSLAGKGLPPVEFVAGTQITGAELIGKMKALPERSFAVISNWIEKESGEYSSAPFLLSRIRQVYPGPVLSPVDTTLGSGLFGGVMFLHQDYAREICMAVDRCLAGESPGHIPVSSCEPVPVVDAREAARLGVPLDSLTAATRIIHAPPPFLDRTGIRLLFLLLTALVVVALVAEVLRRQRNRYAALNRRKLALLNAITDGIIETDADGVVLDMNPAAEAVTGISLKEAAGMSVEMLLPLFSSKDHAPLPSLVAEALHSDRLVSAGEHAELRRRDGGRCHVSLSAVRLCRKKTDSTCSVLLVLRDTTAEYRQKRELAMRNGMLELAARISGLSCFICRSDGTGIELARYQPIWPKEDGRPVPPEKFMFAEDAEELRRAWQELRSNRRKEVSLSFRSNYYGETRYYSMRVVPSKDFYSTGHRRYFGILQDFTHVRMNEQKYQNTWSLLQLILDNLPCGIFVKNPDDGGRYVLCNRMFGSIVGVDSRAIAGKTDWELFKAAGEAARFSADDREVIETGASIDKTELYTGADGVVRTSRTIKSRLIQQDGSRLLVGLSIDISRQVEVERKLSRALEQARLAAQAKSTFLATMSHEIRTPLNAVIGLSDLLRSPRISDAQRVAFSEAINTSGKALLQLINDVLDLSKIEAMKMELRPGPVSLTQLLSEVHQIFAQSAADKGLEFEFVPPEPEPPKLLLDEVRVRQVLLNLIGNAVKFTTRGFVKLECALGFNRTPDCEVLITVADSGVGIDPEFMAHLFEPFRQAVNADSRSFEGGSGLGLAISKRLIEQMNGTLDVESSLGVGTTFTVRLHRVPIVEEQPEEPPPPPVPVEEFPGVEVLVVDDAEVNCMVLESVLKRLGCSVRTAFSVDEALEKVARKHPDLVMTDLWMPDRNGADLARALKQDPATADIPVLLVTADTEMTGDADDTQFSTVIYKPINIARISAALKNTLNR